MVTLSFSLLCALIAVVARSLAVIVLSRIVRALIMTQTKCAIHAIRFHCPSILERWAKRSRNLPSPEIVMQVVSMGALVTPVGCKGSENKNVEWRVCFNTGESYLINSLNNTQINVYVPLKMIVKKVLYPTKKELTSYIVKNIVLWLAESNPEELFQEFRLLELLRLGIENFAVLYAQRSYLIT